jgi:hypothetical protein
MRRIETLFVDVLRHRGGASSSPVPVDGRNRTTAGHYGISSKAALRAGSSSYSVMPSPPAVSIAMAPELRQKPTSNRWGNVVGKGVIELGVFDGHRSRARRRVFVVAPEGWAQ